MSKPPFICSWARRSRLKRPLDRGASSFSTLESGLQLVVLGSVVVFIFLSLPLANAASTAVAQFPTLFGRNSPRFLAISGPVPVPLSTSSDQESLRSARDSLGPAQDSLGPYSRDAWFLHSLVWTRFLWALSSSLLRLLRSGYDSSVCWDRIIDNVLLKDWVPVPVGGLVGRGNSSAPNSSVLLKPGFLDRSNPLKPPSTFQDSHLVCS